jgi:hypothetical protein
MTKCTSITIKKVLKILKKKNIKNESMCKVVKMLYFGIGWWLWGQEQ